MSEVRAHYPTGSCFQFPGSVRNLLCRVVWLLKARIEEVMVVVVVVFSLFKRMMTSKKVNDSCKVLHTISLAVNGDHLCYKYKGCWEEYQVIVVDFVCVG